MRFGNERILAFKRMSPRIASFEQRFALLSKRRGFLMVRTQALIKDKSLTIRSLDEQIYTIVYSPNTS